MELLLVSCVGKFKVFECSFGCLAGLGGRGVALIKKRSPVFQKV